MRTRSYGWLGPLLALLLIACIGLGAAYWVTRARPSGALPTATPSPDAPAASGVDTRTPLTPRAVPFPSIAIEDHPFPLDGAHLTVACEACHPDGAYQGTPQECVDCHPDPHDGLFGQPCVRCHDTVDFYGEFDHVDAVDCDRCHAGTAPAGHYAGQCSRCHLNTTDWTQIEFDHTGYADCQSCHSDAAPASHYAGQCSQCHSSTTDWAVVQFNHSGFTDCVSCHSIDAPASHYPGQCSQCHGTDSWAGVQFNHGGFTDCASCHNVDTPANHYPGQCSNCHASTTDWAVVQFNHSGFTDCVSCHSGDAPANHYPGQCSQCHGTDSWAGATFRHTFPLDHGGANRNCATCHPGGNTSSYTCYNCHSQREIAEKHLDEGISGFQNCMRCHPTGRED